MTTSSFANLLPEKRAFQGALLRWYSLHQRDLPWRKTADPYKIMVSEFMLQQTRIETVIPYYERFLKAFPSLPRLAAASLQRVLKAWAGLGYYARARNLHAAARIILRELDGRVPTTREDLLALPGFGPYTAGAVASIAFNRKASALDGNVKRVLSRLSGVFDSSSFPEKKKLEELAEDLLPDGRASEFNQALMDLGATVCLPARPKCPSCPVRRFCSFPGREKSAGRRRERKRREEIWAVALVEKGGRLLIHRNDERGLLSGLWQFPAVVVPRRAGSLSEDNGGPVRKALRQNLREVFGIKVTFRRPLPSLQHSFTHIQATLVPYPCVPVSDPDTPRPVRPPLARWVDASGLSRYPVSRAMMKVASLLKTSPNGVSAGKIFSGKAGGKR